MRDRASHRNRGLAATLAFALGLVLVLGLGACGRKAPLEAPPQKSHTDGAAQIISEGGGEHSVSEPE